MNHSSRPTIRSMARALGLSRTTVSEALRNQLRVNTRTHARVQEAARATGYQFNPLVSSILSEIRRTRLSTFHVGYCPDLFPRVESATRPRENRPDPVGCAWSLKNGRTPAGRLRKTGRMTH